MVFRMAERSDLDMLVKVRINFVADMKPIDNEAVFTEDTRRYISEHIGGDDFAMFIAVDEGRIVSSCMACVFTTIPLLSCPSGKTAELLNVHTDKAYRRKGYAEKLINMLFDELKNRGVQKVLLQYTDMGYPVYKKLGFEELGRQMVIKF